MSNPTIPPEAVEAAARVLVGAFFEEASAETQHLFRMGLLPASESKAGAMGRVRPILTAALPHLRRAILETEVPRIVEMARARLRDERRTYWQHDPASILAALEE